MEQTTPELPSDEELVEQVRQWPRICLREMSALIWPDLSWLDVSQCQLLDDGPERRTLACWLRDRMRTLLAEGRVQLAPFHADEPGIGGLSYVIGSS